ncbi:hypothetical protein [Ferruginibacter profundus]
MRKLIYPFFILSLTACGQTQTGKIKQVVSNSKTTKHINIPGTRLFVIPPVNFSVSKTFLGLQKGESSMLNVYDLVGGNFYTNTATFSKESFEKQGVKIFDYKEIKVDGYPAKYISMQGDPAAKAIALVFGDTTFSVMIMAAYPVNEELTGKQIIDCLNTIYYDKSKKIEPFETANFSLSDKESKFKFYQYSSNLYIYSIDGKDNSSDKEAPILLVTQLPMSNSATVKSISDMMIGKAQQYGLTNPEIKNISNEKRNGYDTYQAEVYGQLQGKSGVIYICSVAKDDKAIVIQGIAKKDIENNLAEFKKLAATIKLK